MKLYRAFYDNQLCKATLLKSWMINKLLLSGVLWDFNKPSKTESWVKIFLPSLTFCIFLKSWHTLILEEWNLYSVQWNTVVIIELCKMHGETAYWTTDCMFHVALKVHLDFPQPLRGAQWPSRTQFVVVWMGRCCVTVIPRWNASPFPLPPSSTQQLYLAVLSPLVILDTPFPFFLLTGRPEPRVEGRLKDT